MPETEPLETEQAFREKVVADRIALDEQVEPSIPPAIQPSLTPREHSDKLALAALVWFLEKAGGYKKIPNQALDAILTGGSRRVNFERKEDHVKVTVTIPEDGGDKK